MIALRGITKSYRLGERRVPVLGEINLGVPRGQFLAIMGPSGSGKSTLLNILGCLDVADEGSYHLEERLLSARSEDDLSQLRNQAFGFVFQAFNLLPRFTALENVELPLIYSRVGVKERRERAAAALAAVGLGARLHHRPAQLSGGQQQRVAIARAMVNSPKILIADEPTGALDSRAGEEIMAIFDSLHRRGTTLVMVTHEPEIAARAERNLYLRDGAIIEDRLR